MKDLIEIIKDHTENKWGIILIICVSTGIVSALLLIIISILMYLQ